MQEVGNRNRSSNNLPVADLYKRFVLSDLPAIERDSSTYS